MTMEQIGSGLFLVHADLDRYLLVLGISVLSPFAVVRWADPVYASALFLHLSEQVSVVCSRLENL